MTETNPISNTVGAIWKTTDERIWLIPLLPLSIDLTNPPTWDRRWKLRSRFCTWKKMFFETLLMALWATLLKSEFLNSWNKIEPNFAPPYPINAAPQTDTTFSSCGTSSRSTTSLKKNGTLTDNILPDASKTNAVDTLSLISYSSIHALHTRPFFGQI